MTDPLLAEPGGRDKAAEERIRRKTRAGKLDASGLRFGIVVSRFNEFITDRLLRSAYDGLVRSGANEDHIEILRVPGAFEIPSAARTLAETGQFDAIVCLGCLLRGETAHYDVIVNEVTRGIGQSAQETGIPHAFGVLTCDTLEQAIDRAGLKLGNKGFEAALSALEMANLERAVRAGHSANRAKRAASGAGPGTRANERNRPARLRRSPRKTRGSGSKKSGKAKDPKTRN